MNDAVRKLVQHKLYMYMTIVCTVWVLGGDDVYILQDPPMELDKPIYSLYVVCALHFFIDSLLRGVCEPNYRFRFYFWLDVIAFISLAPEVVYVIADYDIFDLGVASLARSGRAASAETPIMAGARVVRILRIVKLLKQVYEIKKKRIHRVENDLGDTSASELARKLEEYVTIHVIIAVGAMLALSMALTIAYACNSETILSLYYKKGNQPGKAKVKNVLAFRQVLELALRVYVRPLAACMGRREDKLDPSEYNIECIEKWKDGNIIDMRQRFLNKPNSQPLVYLEVSTVKLYGDPESYHKMFRKKPLSYLIREFNDIDVGSGTMVVHLGNTDSVHDASYANLFTVCSVLCVIWILSITLTTSMRTEILGPMERIVKIIESLIHDPMAKHHTSNKDDAKHTRKQDKHVYEVEKAILRVGGLLQLGLGEAGAKIISDNMKDGDMVLDKGGKLVHSIFGFCDIRNFTDATEVLRADIVKLVNSVAKHVHECTIDNYGAPNKNIGDAFLLVWKPKGDMGISTVADASLRSYVRVMVQMQMCKEMKRWEKKSALQARMPGFSVRLGFGLHYGWAVEGAIGSVHKIDASYLSPHVNMAARLEAATKQYGTAILLSDSIYTLMSGPVRSLCRLIDRVTVKGSVQPVSLYTYDVPSIVSRGGDLPDDTPVQDNQVSAHDFFTRLVPPSTPLHFRQLHKRGMDYYLGGPNGAQADWPKATILLRRCLEMRPSDGPSAAILHVIENAQQEDGTAPTGWQGFRPLAEK